MNIEKNINHHCFTYCTDEDYVNDSLEGRAFKLLWSSNPKITQETILSYFHIDNPKDRDYYDSDLYDDARWIEFCSKSETKIVIEVMHRGNKERSLFGFNSKTCFCLCYLKTLDYINKEIQKDPEWTIVDSTINKETEDIYLSFFRKNGIEPTYRNKNLKEFLDYYEIKHDLVNRSYRKPEEYAKEIRFMFWNRNLRHLTTELRVDLFKMLTDLEVKKLFEDVKAE